MTKKFSFIALLLTLPMFNFAFNVTFRVDMQGVELFSVPEVNGTFNNWCGNCATMTDADGDGIWERTLNLNAGNYEYKFSFDNWSGQEELPPFSSCTVTLGQFTNRVLNVSQDVVLDVYCFGSCAACELINEDEWQLEWSEEFDGNSLDNQTWTAQIGAGGWGNSEWQYYTDSESNIEVSNGTLKITARNENIQNSNYTSARLITNDKYEFMYGRVEGRIKVPYGQGIWPAFWMLGGNFETVSWPQCGEIDIMEHINNENQTHGTVHWNNNGSHAYVGAARPIDATEFHDYGVIWNSDELRFYVDEVVYYTYTFSSSNNSEQIFNNPFFFLLNVAVGGNWPGYPDNTTTFPAQMEVDYVRVYSNDIQSVNEETNSRFQIFPNPANDRIQIRLTEQSFGQPVKIFNQMGQLVHQSTLTAQNTSISIEELSSGVYTVQIGDAVQRIVKK